jgi:hypothetical protein
MEEDPFDWLFATGGSGVEGTDDMNGVRVSPVPMSLSDTESDGGGIGGVEGGEASMDEDEEAFHSILDHGRPSTTGFFWGQVRLRNIKGEKRLSSSREDKREGAAFTPVSKLNLDQWKQKEPDGPAERTPVNNAALLRRAVTSYTRSRQLPSDVLTALETNTKHHREEMKNDNQVHSPTPGSPKMGSMHLKSSSQLFSGSKSSLDRSMSLHKESTVSHRSTHSRILGQDVVQSPYTTTSALKVTRSYKVFFSLFTTTSPWFILMAGLLFYEFILA